MRNRLQTLMANKGELEKRRVSLSEVSDHTGINRQTLTDWRDNKITRYDGDVIEILCRYFKCDVSDLLEIFPPVEKESA